MTETTVIQLPSGKVVILLKGKIQTLKESK